MAFTTLAHHIDVDWLREAYRRTRKDGATGVDGQSAEEYAENLEDNLRSLLDRAKSGTYRAPPVRRVHIPKGDGSETRPHRHPDLRGQGPAARGRDGAGGRLRAGLSRTARTASGRGARRIRRWSAAEQAMRMAGGWVLEVESGSSSMRQDKPGASSG